MTTVVAVALIEPLILADDGRLPPQRRGDPKPFPPVSVAKEIWNLSRRLDGWSRPNQEGDCGSAPAAGRRDQTRRARRGSRDADDGAVGLRAASRPA